MSALDPPSTLHFFVDEAGDPTLFNAKGRILVGQEGCSKSFILGKLDVDDPAALHVALGKLRADLLADPYFKRVPSMQAERGESRYVELIWDKVVEIEDMDRVEGGRKGVLYNARRPLIVDQEATE
ncbi:MAG TPA: hypothetical protein PK752_23550 [Accumulibacter sp.]|uniref:hypothetical protein n=1 Tax=Accumulibacter sp. TaxID=2053492 RepID=UPI002C2E8AB0|nr:hypothetical protein [Accumulibacter sp.]HRD91203.1 hypothetical protein [Accumulibacter sp.]